MRKISLLIMLLAIVGIGFAQQNLLPRKMNRTIDISETIGKPVPDADQLKGLEAMDDTIWYNDCSNPADWTISNGPTYTGGTWEIGVSGGSLDTYTNVSTFHPPTKANGGLFINGVQYLVSGNVPMMDSYITTSQSINLSSYNGVVLAFHERYRAFNDDDIYVEVSTNNINWTAYQLHDELSANAYYPGDYTEINISASAANASTVWIRFHFVSTSEDDQFGGGYGWRIDDVLIKEAASYNMKMLGGWSNFFYTNGGYCSQVPKDQAYRYFFLADLSNEGSNNLTNPSFNVVVDNGFNDVFDYSFDSIGSWTSLSRDTIVMDSAFLPDYVAADYHASFTITANETDEVMSNNSFEIDFSVSDSTYAHDHGVVTSSISPANYTGGVDGDLIGSQYYIAIDDTVSSISVWIASGTTLGTVIKAELYKYDSGLGENVLIIDSEEHEIVQSDIGGWLTLPFTSDDDLQQYVVGDAWYYAMLSFYWGSNTLAIGNDESNTAIHDFTQETSLRLGGTWYYIFECPMVRLNMFRTPINVCDPILSAADISDVTCFNANNGSISLSVGGGDGNYSYSWSTGATTPAISGLTNGTYTVTLSSCGSFSPTNVVNTYTVDGPTSALSVTPIFSLPSCGGSNGVISLTVDGGGAPYTYSWTGGSTTGTIIGIPAGAYHYVVTDSYGCVISANAILTTPPSPAVTANIVHETAALNDGSIDLVVANGTAPFSYIWGGGQTTSTLSGIAGGWYYVTVTDVMACDDEAAFLVIPYNTNCTVTGNTINTNVSCNGLSNGISTVVANNGTSPYIYYWSTGSSAVSITGLAAGNYAVTIQDADFCFAIVDVTITEPPVIEASYAITASSCPTAHDGSINLTPSGGTPPYTYIWSNITNAQDLNNVLAGSYPLTITDSKGCKYMELVTITAGTSTLEATFVTTEASCAGVSDGAIDVTVSGGFTPYSYSWENGSTTEDLSNVQPGSYSVIVTDNQGCVFADSVDVVAGTTPMTIILDDALGPNTETNGHINITVVGNAAPYTYLWSNGSTIEDPTALAEGSYLVTVTDANGCIQTGGPFALVGIGEIMAQNVSIYPNPTNGKLFVVNAEKSVITIYNILGEQVVKINNAKKTETIDFSRVANGTYLVKIELENTIISKKISVTR